MTEFENNLVLELMTNPENGYLLGDVVRGISEQYEVDCEVIITKALKSRNYKNNDNNSRKKLIEKYIEIEGYKIKEPIQEMIFSPQRGVNYTAFLLDETNLFPDTLLDIISFVSSSNIKNSKIKVYK